MSKEDQLRELKKLEELKKQVRTGTVSYPESVKLYSSKTGAKVLGVKPDTLKHYALRWGIGYQPGGPNTPWVFTLEDLKHIRRIRSMGERSVKRNVQMAENRDELELGPWG